MANEVAIKGTTIIVGFATGETVSGIIRDTHDTDHTADIEYIRDENTTDGTALVSNLGHRITIAGVCSSAQTTAKGDVVTVNSIKYLCETAIERRTKLAYRFELTLYKPTAMTLT